MNDLLAQVEKCKNAKGIAYTYANEGKEEVLLNPDWVSMHTKPMAITDEEGNTVYLNDVPLVFKNNYAIEGAYALLEVFYPETAKKFKMSVYTKEKGKHDLHLAVNQVGGKEIAEPTCGEGGMK